MRYAAAFIILAMMSCQAFAKEYIVRDFSPEIMTMPLLSKAGEAKTLARAEKGDIEAVEQLCRQYRYTGNNDYNVDQRTIFPKAFPWCRKAADYGFDQAFIGYCYDSGDCGVEKDPVEAYFWFALALKTSKDEHADYLDPLEAKVPSEKLAAVKKRVEEWKPLSK